MIIRRVRENKKNGKIKNLEMYKMKLNEESKMIPMKKEMKKEEIKKIDGLVWKMILKMLWDK